MSDLLAFQTRFARALASPGDSFDAQPAFAVYRNTSAKGVRDALAANYPTVARLLGDVDFERVAMGHARRCPPVSPVLADYGAGFAAVCADADPDRPFIADVARIDRLWTEAHFAADADAVSAAAIVGLVPDRLMALRLGLHPATRCGWFDTPAPSIWMAHRHDERLSALSVAWQAEGILLTRAEASVAWRPAAADLVALVDAFAGGETLADVGSDFLQRCPDADLSQLFAQLLEAGALVALPNL